MHADITTHMEVIVSRVFLPIAQGAPAILADPLVLLAIVVGILGIAYMIIRYRSRDAVGPSSAQQDAQHQMQALIQEFEEASRQMAAEIDTKAERLQLLIAEADARRTALDAVLARTKAQDMSRKLISGVPDGGEAGLGALARHHEIYELADSGQNPAAIAQKLGRPCGEVELILALRGS